MSGYCCVPSCFERRTSNPNISLHCFPKNLELRAKWCEAIGGPSFQPNKTSKVCLQHFRKEDFTVTKCETVLIKAGAIPSIFQGTKNENKDANQNTRVSKPNSPGTVQIKDVWGYAADGPSFQPSVPTHGKRKFFAGDYDIKDMECSELAKCFFRAVMKEKQEFSKRMKTVQRQNIRLTKRLIDLKSLLETYTEGKTAVCISDDTDDQNFTDTEEDEPIGKSP